MEQHGDIMHSAVTNMTVNVCKSTLHWTHQPCRMNAAATLVANEEEHFSNWYDSFLHLLWSWVEPTMRLPQLHHCTYITRTLMCSTVEWRHHTLSQPGDIPLQLKCHVGASLSRPPKRQAVVVTQQRRLHTRNCVNKDRSNTHRSPETPRCRVTQNAPLPPT